VTRHDAALPGRAASPDAAASSGTAATPGEAASKPDPVPASGPAAPPVPATPSPGITLRAMTRADLPAVVRLEHHLFGDEAWSEAMLASELDGAPGGRHYLVAEDAGEAGAAQDSRARGQLVGYAGLLSPDGGQADVLTMAVAQDRWGQRIGAMLLDGLIAEAAQRGCTEVFLEVRVDNDRAQRLYRSRGFTEIGLRRGYYQPSGTDALVMQLSLPRPRRFGFAGTRRRDMNRAAGGPR
jgi:[ribosomal protein S18]-alanine N-acetyltransferase